MDNDTLEKVRDLGHLYRLANEKKSIKLIGGGTRFIGHQGHVPAAWAINWNGHMIYCLLPHMFVYKPKEKKSAESPTEEKTSL